MPKKTVGWLVLVVLLALIRAVPVPAQGNRTVGGWGLAADSGVGLAAGRFSLLSFSLSDTPIVVGNNGPNVNGTFFMGGTTYRLAPVTWNLDAIEADIFPWAPGSGPIAVPIGHLSLKSRRTSPIDGYHGSGFLEGASGEPEKRFHCFFLDVAGMGAAKKEPVWDNAAAEKIFDGFGLTRQEIGKILFSSASSSQSAGDQVPARVVAPGESTLVVPDAGGVKVVPPETQVIDQGR